MENLKAAKSRTILADRVSELEAVLVPLALYRFGSHSIANHFRVELLDFTYSWGIVVREGRF